jgi:predicted transcriptional regulator
MSKSNIISVKELTRFEEQIMQILWKIGKGFVNDILDKLPEPRPAYNTVSTIVRILEKKGFVNYTTMGKSHQYYPAVSKKDYTRSYMKRFVNNYFGNSYKEMVSFFTQEENLSLEEMDEIRKFMNDQIKKSKQP